MSSFDTRSNSAVMKRAEQLKRWEESDTNRVSGQPKNEKNRKIKFSSGCVFLAACLSGDKDEVVNLLDTGADINTANVDGLTALHQACIDDNLEMVEFLIEHGADINRQDNEGWTPLHATASCGFVSIARYLVEHGADLRAVNSDGDLPVDIAHLSGMVEYMQNLVEEHGIDCESARKVEEQMMLNDAKKWLRSDASEADKPHPKTGATALHVAAAKGYTKVLGLLLAGRANVDKQDNDGWAPLHAAAHWCQKESAEMLVDAMADMDIKNYAGQTCIDVADRKMIKFLEELRANNKRIKNRRPSSQIRISDAIENHNESGTPTKLIRVEVKSDSKDTTKDEKSPRAINDSIKPAPETADDDAPWRRGSTIRSRIPPENPPKTPQVNEKDVKSTDSDVILRRTQSFENDEKFYQKYHELRARIKANSCPTLPATQTPGVLGTVITPNQNYSVQRSASLIDHRHFRKPMSPAINPNTPAAVPNTGQVRRSFVPPVRDEESETQRKAHAKRVRETRRSTQGVTLDEIKSAEELVKKKNLSINNNNNNNTSTESQNTTTTITSSTTTTPSTQSSPPQASSATAATITTTIITDNYLTNATTPTLSILTTPTTTTTTPPTSLSAASSSLSSPITKTTTTTTNISPTTMNDQVSPSVYLNESPSKLIAMEKADRKDDVTASFTLKPPIKLKDASSSENDEAITTTTTTTTASYTIMQQSSPKTQNLISNDDNKDSKFAIIITENCDDDSIINSNSNNINISSTSSNSSSNSSNNSSSSSNINISKIVKNATQQQLSPKKISISNVIDKTKTDEENDESSNANNIKKLITSNKNNNKMIDNNKLQNEMISHINDDNKSSSTPIIREKHRSLFDIDNANSLTLADKLRNEANKYYDDTKNPIKNSNPNTNPNANENSNTKINSDNENDNDNKQTVVNVAIGSNCKSTNKDTDKDCANNISVTNRKCDSTPSSPLHHNMTERRPSWRLKFDAGCKFKLEDATSGTTFPSNNSTIISSAPAVIAAANLSSVSAQRRNIATNTLNTTNPTNPTQRPLSAPTISSTIASNSNELIDLTNSEEPSAIRRNRNTEDKENDKENDGRSAMSTQAVIQRRRKPKRRSTGVVHIDIDDIDPERQEPNPDVDEKESGNERNSRSRVGSTTSSLTDPDHIGDKRKCANDSTENGELIDYKALWEAAKLENDKLKLQLKKKDDDIITAKAAVERFANAQLEAFKTENQRLKEENGALIRVISKLSK